MRLSILHRTVYRYAAPVVYSIQQLRLTPRTEPHQRTLRWRLHAPAPLTPATDAYGNTTHTLTMTGAHGDVQIEAGVLRLGGRMVFDHINPPWLRANLKFETERRSPSGATIRERRRIDEKRSRVEKTVRINQGGMEDRLVEQVRFYERAELEALARRAGLQPLGGWGDFDGRPLSPDAPRAIYLLEKR